MYQNSKEELSNCLWEKVQKSTPRTVQKWASKIGFPQTSNIESHCNFICRCVRPPMRRNVNHHIIMVRHVRTFPSKSVNIRRNVTLSTVNLVKMSQNSNVPPPMNNIARSVTESFPISWFIYLVTAKFLVFMKVSWFWTLTPGYS